jgi:lambda repressor-like predicted transcriptional regulator
MHAHDIEAKLKKSGHTQTTVARELQVPRSTIYAVLHGKGRSRKVEERISELIKVPLAELWPQWYGEAGGAVQVSGDGNVVAGRDQVGIRESGPSYGAKLTIAEERWLRLFRALEPSQQDEVEKFMRQKIAGVP